ncbi:MAG: hypothetical protein DMF56_26995 [Acidobacteria bacterium]|nr:MAG: hypothetical protein DMF56_26995 [Acidobacteriota bacterium]
MAQAYLPTSSDHGANGWIGRADQLYHVLRMFRCDQDAAGKFCVDGSITSFMGAGDEYVVGADAVYYVDGKPCNLVAALRVTSYGLAVTVIS